jgi:hypothetical protein
MLRRRALALLAVALAVAATIWFTATRPPPGSAGFQPAPPPSDSPTPPPPAPQPPPAFSPSRPALAAVAPDPAHPRSPLADTLHSPATTPEDDLRAIAEILRLYRERFGALPAFETNAQLVNALAGANPRRLGLLPRDVPAVSPATGELLDRWGTPLHVHAVSREILELRSAGPDRRLFTADDLLATFGAPSASAHSPAALPDSAAPSY